MNLRHIVKTAILDLRYGSILKGMKASPYRSIGANDTANTKYEELDSVFKDVEIGDAEVLADVGCGKGRVINYWLSRGLRNTMYGIELDPEVAREARRRLRRRQNVRILAGNVLEILPGDVTLLYLFNPFSREVMLRFKAVLDAHKPGDSIRIVYYNAVDKDVFESDRRYSVKTLSAPEIPLPACVITREAGRA